MFYSAHCHCLLSVTPAFLNTTPGHSCLGKHISNGEVDPSTSPSHFKSKHTNPAQSQLQIAGLGKMSNTQSSSLADGGTGQNLVAKQWDSNYAVLKVLPPLPPHQADLMSHEEFVTRFGKGCPSTPGKITWVMLDKITDRYNELCKRFQTFTDEERREMESIVAHCTALNLPVQCANMTGDQDTEDQNTTKAKHRRPNKRKTVMLTTTTMPAPVATSGVLPIVGPPQSSQGVAPSGGHAPTAPTQIPLKRPLDHNDLVAGTDRAPPQAKRTDQGHKKQAHTTANNPPGASTQTLNELPSSVHGDLVESSHRCLEEEARQQHVAQFLGSGWLKLRASSQMAGIIAARQHELLLDCGVPDSCLIPVVYGT